MINTYLGVKQAEAVEDDGPKRCGTKGDCADTDICNAAGTNAVNKNQTGSICVAAANHIGDGNLRESGNDVKTLCVGQLGAYICDVGEKCVKEGRSEDETCLSNIFYRVFPRSGI